MSFTPTVPLRSPLTTALVAYLDDNTSLLVGDGVNPSTAGWQGAEGTSQFVPYLVVHSVPGGEFDGSLGDPYADGTMVWQITAVGAIRQQCEDAADAARIALRSAPTGIAGVQRVRLPERASARIDDSVDPHVFISTERYELETVPA